MLALKAFFYSHNLPNIALRIIEFPKKMVCIFPSNPNQSINLTGIERVLKGSQRIGRQVIAPLGFTSEVMPFCFCSLSWRVCANHRKITLLP